jgi:hypothetical protein
VVIRLEVFELNDLILLGIKTKTKTPKSQNKFIKLTLINP